MRTLRRSAQCAIVVSSLAAGLAACGAAPASAPAASPPPASANAETKPSAAAQPSPAAATAAPAGGGTSPAKAEPKDPLDTPVVVSDSIRAIVAAKDRSDEDRKLDAGRHPAELLAFLGAAPGQRIVEIGSYQGYTAELL